MRATGEIKSAISKQRCAYADRGMSGSVEEETGQTRYKKYNVWHQQTVSRVIS